MAGKSKGLRGHVVGPRGEVGGGLRKGLRGPMGERGAVTIIRRGRCNARGPFGAPDGDADLGLDLMTSPIPGKGSCGTIAN